MDASGDNGPEIDALAHAITLLKDQQGRVGAPTTAGGMKNPAYQTLKRRIEVLEALLERARRGDL